MSYFCGNSVVLSSAFLFVLLMAKGVAPQTDPNAVFEVVYSNGLSYLYTMVNQFLNVINGETTLVDTIVKQILIPYFPALICSLSVSYPSQFQQYINCNSSNNETISTILQNNQYFYSQLLPAVVGPLICILFGIIYVIITCCGCFTFSCCRRCGLCGKSISKKRTQKHDKTKRRILALIVFAILVILTAGVACSLIADEAAANLLQINSSGTNSSGNSTSIELLDSLIGSFDNLSNILNQLLQDIQNIIASLSTTLLPMLEDYLTNATNFAESSVEGLLNNPVFSSALNSFSDLNNNLSQINDTLTSIEYSTQELQQLQLQFNSSLRQITSSIVKDTQPCTVTQSNWIDCNQLYINASILGGNAPGLIQLPNVSSALQQIQTLSEFNINSTINQIFNNSLNQLNLTSIVDQQVLVFLDSIGNITQNFQSTFQSFLPEIQNIGAMLSQFLSTISLSNITSLLGSFGSILGGSTPSNTTSNIPTSLFSSSGSISGGSTPSNTTSNNPTNSNSTFGGFCGGNISCYIFVGLACISSLLELIVILYFIGLLIGICCKQPKDDKQPSKKCSSSATADCCFSCAACCSMGCGCWMMVVVMIFFIFCYLATTLLMCVQSSNSALYTDIDTFLQTVFNTINLTSLPIPAPYNSLVGSLNFQNISLANAIQDCKNNDSLIYIVTNDLIPINQLIQIIEPFLTQLINGSGLLNGLSQTLSGIQLVSNGTLSALNNLVSSLPSSNTSSLGALLNQLQSINSTMLALASETDQVANNMLDTIIANQANDLHTQANNLRILSATTLVSLVQQTNTLISLMNSLNNTSTLSQQINSTVQNLLAAQNYLHSNSTQLIESITNNIISYILVVLPQIINSLLSIFDNYFGCYPLYDFISNDFIGTICNALQPFNAIWFTYGWILFFFIPAMIFGLWLGGLYGRKSVPAGQEETQQNTEKTALPQINPYFTGNLMPPASPYGWNPGPPRSPYAQVPRGPYGWNPGPPGLPYGQVPGWPYGWNPGSPYGQVPGWPYGGWNRGPPTTPSGEIPWWNFGWNGQPRIPQRPRGPYGGIPGPARSLYGRATWPLRSPYGQVPGPYGSPYGRILRSPVSLYGLDPIPPGRLLFSSGWPYGQTTRPIYPYKPSYMVRPSPFYPGQPIEPYHYR